MERNDVGTQSLFAEPLTRREREILALLGDGLTSQEIAGRLTLAISTARWYLQQLYSKLGVNGKREALARARQLGWLPPLPNHGTLSQDQVQPGRPKHNLPRQLTGFIGREGEIEQVKGLLREHPLVTLTGSGGVGKTRLSLKVAEKDLEEYADGAWYVELAPLEEPVLVPQQVAITIGMREDPERSVLEALQSHLSSRQVLLILDNCEHLLDACTHLADVLLHACPRLKILASSREPLGLAGEAIYRVPSLPFPDPAQPPPWESLEDYSAIRLFIDRARLAMPGFRVSEKNALALARICQRLDGIPLAIELAAARAGALSVEKLAERLSNSFRLLAGGSRTALPRQQTLRATIDWSYNLLDEKERILFRRLPAFAAGCTLEAAEQVCAFNGLERDEVLDRLISLVDKSMVIAEPKQGEETRYRLLETVRQYAREKLQEAGESSFVRTRHLDYFLKFAETHKKILWSTEASTWLRKLEAERENVRYALEWSIDDPDNAEGFIRLLLAVDLLWIRYQYFQEAVDWHERGLVLCQNHSDISPELYARFLGAASHRMALNHPKTALAWAKQAVKIARRVEPENIMILIECLLDLVGITMGDLGDVEGALAPCAEAEALFQTLDPQHYPEQSYLRTKAHLFKAKAGIAGRQARYEDMKNLTSDNLRIDEQRGKTVMIGGYINLGTAHLNLGEFEQARQCFQIALDQAEKYDSFLRAYTMRSLGLVYFRQGKLEQALDCCRRGIRIAAEVPDRNVIANCLGVCACILAKSGEILQAARLSGAAHSLYERQGRKPMEDSSLDTILPGWQESPEREAILIANEEGRAMPWEQAVAIVG